jgi:hypothetical protein
MPLALTTDHWSQVTVRGVDVFDPTTGEVRSRARTVPIPARDERVIDNRPRFGPESQAG